MIVVFLFFRIIWIDAFFLSLFPVPLFPSFFLSLYIYIPVKETIDIFINNIYSNQSLPRKINLNILPKILLTCTIEVTFYDHLGNVYIQKDGVSMGSVLDLIFSNSVCPILEIECLIASETLHIPKICWWYTYSH